jgi:putative SOS response-associated peptidase YedK
LHQDKYVSEQVTHKDGGPLVMNAFEMITLSQGLDLSSLFDRQQVIVLPSFSQHVWLFTFSMISTVKF